jgi:hypothetical protein
VLPDTYPRDEFRPPPRSFDQPHLGVWNPAANQTPEGATVPAVADDRDVIGLQNLVKLFDSSRDFSCPKHVREAMITMISGIVGEVPGDSVASEKGRASG